MPCQICAWFIFLGPRSCVRWYGKGAGSVLVWMHAQFVSCFRVAFHLFLLCCTGFHPVYPLPHAALIPNATSFPCESRAMDRYLLGTKHKWVMWSYVEAHHIMQCMAWPHFFTP
ncbi:hypothetical protein, unlikely [Trypanosoma brucei gambiense DAL972]|uniref:Uncharacterized protein n=1 Tax=Trypanosoma brucei gambiense (strain MHOM/CI/86/DAL972) TaxID=679716 RepID=C9ZWG4_TRYB9|nr:hypothetical protein, unlikely [Trypanosoma brucei gambiense DAL972]CBH13753.1 hypothetical protein, unlikely [Trypanosoma brucei gambiense DAL972]|eukprot:XP_011776029.1 hypothetical protein, unlikely [Trypanosoma brucei gambiense DAL972]